MNLVVMQLSATPNKWRFVLLSFATGILVHMFFIGLTIAWCASKAPQNAPVRRAQPDWFSRLDIAGRRGDSCA